MRDIQFLKKIVEEMDRIHKLFLSKKYVTAKLDIDDVLKPRTRECKKIEPMCLKKFD